jgi:hypothetical protein
MEYNLAFLAELRTRLVNELYFANDRKKILDRVSRFVVEGSDSLLCFRLRLAKRAQVSYFRCHKRAVGRTLHSIVYTAMNVRIARCVPVGHELSNVRGGGRADKLNPRVILRDVAFERFVNDLLEPRKRQTSSRRIRKSLARIFVLFLTGGHLDSVCESCRAEGEVAAEMCI